MRKITIELYQEDSHIKATIEDNGIGFSELKNKLLRTVGTNTSWTF